MGGIRKMTLSFEEAGSGTQSLRLRYVVYINGQEVLINSPDGLHRFPGRVDVYLERADGGKVSLTGLSWISWAIKFISFATWPVSEWASFAAQLMDHPNECTPELDSDILTYHITPRFIRMQRCTLSYPSRVIK